MINRTLVSLVGSTFVREDEDEEEEDEEYTVRAYYNSPRPLPSAASHAYCRRVARLMPPMVHTRWFCA